MMRAVPNCAVLYPCDAVSTERLVAEMAAYHGLAYMRTSRPKTDDHLRPRRAVPDWRIEGALSERRRRRHRRGGGGDRLRGAQGVRAAEGRAHSDPRHRRLLRAADRRRHAHRRGQGHQRRDYHGRGSLRCRAGSATPSAKPSRRPGSSSIAWPCASCRAAARPPSCSITTASPPGTSSTPCETLS